MGEKAEESVSGILESLKVKTGCEFLSDLRTAPYRIEAEELLDIDDSIPASAGEAALAYIRSAMAEKKNEP